jgi:hypothetical protein
MRRLAGALLGCLLLTGCAGSWQGDDVRYKIVSTDNSMGSDMFQLELVGDAPKGALEPGRLTPHSVFPSDISGGAAVGGEVLCVVEQKKGSAVGDSNVVTNVKSCKKA